MVLVCLKKVCIPLCRHRAEIITFLNYKIMFSLKSIVVRNPFALNSTLDVLIGQMDKGYEHRKARANRLIG